MPLINATTRDDIRIEVIGEGRAVTRRASKFIDLHDNESLNTAMLREKISDLQSQLKNARDNLHADLHNTGATLTGNTQQTDLEWLACRLFDWSRLGAGDVKTVDGMLNRRQWADLGLEPIALLGAGACVWDALNDGQKDAWLRLARIVFYVLPMFVERVGHRFMEQASALRQVWAEQR